MRPIDQIRVIEKDHIECKPYGGGNSLCNILVDCISEEGSTEYIHCGTCVLNVPVVGEPYDVPQNKEELVNLLKLRFVLGE